MLEENNKVVNKIDALVNKKQKLVLEYKKLQRQRDLKVDTINQKYSDKIDRVLRKVEFVKMQMEQANEYARKNLQGGQSNE